MTLISFPRSFLNKSRAHLKLLNENVVRLNSIRDKIIIELKQGQREKNVFYRVLKTIFKYLLRDDIKLEFSLTLRLKIRNTKWHF